MRIKDHMLSGEDFSLEYNADLELFKTVPTPENLLKYYQSEDYISHTDSQQSLRDRVYQWVKQIQFVQKRKRLLREFPANARVLDVGTGTGDWPHYLLKKGHQATGLETNPGARQRAADKGVRVVGSWEELGDDLFDCITLWHVLEHVPEPKETLHKIWKHLEPGGSVFIAVPNYRSWDAQHYKEYWAAYDVPRHLWHFSSYSIKFLGEQSGFHWVRKYPMVFDAFYVCLLSESYKGRPSVIKAIWAGIRSTGCAWVNGEHSSMLYVLRKG